MSDAGASLSLMGMHGNALNKSNEECQKYKVAQQTNDKEQSLKEIEEDIKRLIKV